MLLVIYITLYFINLSKKPFQGTKGFYDLSIPDQQTLTHDQFAWSSRPCTLRFAINVLSAPKTIAKVDCITVSGEANKFAPKCDDYSFSSCKCVGRNCQNCSIQNSEYLTQLMGLGDYVQLWASGYTSQNDKPYVPAILKIRTGSDSSSHYMESISLPAIPLQKWTVITIVKEGRRFDVYYGATLQTSKMTDYIPITPDASLAWTVGNKKWQGKVGLFMGYTKAFFAPDVLTDVEKLVNTRGVPYYKEDNTNYNVFNHGCMFGNCNSLPNVKPRSPFTVYDTSVA